MQSLQVLAAEVANGMDATEQRFETIHKIIELLTVEDEPEDIYVRCMLSDADLFVALREHYLHGNNVQQNFPLTVRIAL